MAAVVAVIVQLLIVPQFGGLSVDFLHWIDAMRQTSPAARLAPVAVIAIDEETYRVQPFAGTPSAFWTKEIASVLAAVVAGGASVVGFDVILSTTVQRYVPGHDREFLIALRDAAQAGRVVLGKVQHQVHPIEPFRGQIVAVTAGEDHNTRSTNLFRDPDDVIRRVPLVLDVESSAPPAQNEPSMALELAARHLGVRPAIGADGRIRLAGWAIPGSEAKNLLLRFPSPMTRVSTFSLADLTSCAASGDRDFFERHFRGRVVLIGAFLDVEDRKLTSTRFSNAPEAAYVGPRCVRAPMTDLHRDDLVRSTVPGVYVHAAAVTNLLERNALSELDWSASLAVLFVLALGTALLTMSLGPLVAAVAALVSTGAWAAAGVAAFDHALAFPILPGAVAIALALTVTLAYRIGVADRDQRFLRRSFALYLAPPLVHQLLTSGNSPRLGGETREITAFFCDLAGFSALTEDNPAENVVEVLNTYFSAMTEVIEREGGFVDKYVGDALVAVFGAPIALPDHARRAVHAALAFQARLQELNATVFRARPLGHRIGIATGPAVVGNIGSGRRFNYTAVGDVMNVAARIEEANKYYGTAILCTESTRIAAGDIAAWRQVARMTVRGRRAEVTLFEPSLMPVGDRGVGSPA